MPALIEVRLRPESTPEAVTATAAPAEAVVVPLPSWPEAPPPQQCAALLAMAQEWVLPAEMAVTFPEVATDPVTATGEDWLLAVVTPLPTRPLVVRPQQ